MLSPRRPGWTAPFTTLTAVDSVAELKSLAVHQNQVGDPDGFAVLVRSVNRPFQLLPIVQPEIPMLVLSSRDPLRMWYGLAAEFGPAANPWLQQVDWWVDPVSGNDENSGDASTRALATIYEWQRRLQGARFSRGYRIRMLGPLSELNLQLDLGALGYLNLDFSPAAVTLDQAHVALYVPPNGVNQYGILSLVEALNLNPYRFARVRFLTGAAAGGVCWIALVNPLGGGANTARVTQPVWVDPDNVLSPPLTLAHVLPGLGDLLAIEALISVGAVGTNFFQGSSPDFGLNSLVISHAAVGGATAVPTVVQCSNAQVSPTFLWACDLRAQTLHGNLQTIGCSCHADGFGIYATGVDWLSSLTLEDSLIWDGTVTSNVFLFDSLVQDAQLFPAAGRTSMAGHVAVFDAPGDGIVAYGAGVSVESAGLLYGTGNIGFGVNLRSGGAMLDYLTKPTITGTVGDTSIHGNVRAWGLIPWVDPASGAGIVATVP